MSPPPDGAATSTSAAHADRGASDPVAERRVAVLATGALDVLTPLLAAGSPCALVDFPHHANVGDSAIWLGERALLDRAGVPIRYTCDLHNFAERDLRERVPTGTILIHGGGNLGDLWPDHQDFREHLVRAFPRHRIIQLPQSIHFGRPSNLRRAQAAFGAHPDLTLCVRDQRSLDFARRHFSSRSVLCPDMAFGIPQLPVVACARVRDIVWQARADHESAGLPLPPLDDTVWLTDWVADPGDDPAWTAQAASAAALAHAANPTSAMGERASASDQLAALHLRRGCRMLRSGRAIVTDRLHGHLLSLLLGLPHVILGDRFGKVAGAHATWTRDWPGVRWARSTDEALALARELAAP